MNKKEIKCIFLDIDGTLDNSDRVTTNYTKNILKKLSAQGIISVICSGRMVPYAINKSINASCSKYVIADNGAIVYDYKSKKVIFEDAFDFDTMLKVNKICLKYKVECLFNTTTDAFKCNDYNYHKYNRGTIINSIDMIKHNVTQIIISSNNLDDMKAAREEILKLGNIQVSNTNMYKKKRLSNNYYCDLNLVGNSKGKAIAKLIEYLDIDSSNIMCFGDSMNDFSMFEICQYKVAMKNASEELKEKATAITEYDNDNDGLAKYIEENIL